MKVPAHPTSTRRTYIKQVLTGNTPGNISTTDTIKEKIDDSGIADQGQKDGDTYGTVVRQLTEEPS